MHLPRLIPYAKNFERYHQELSFDVQASFEIVPASDQDASQYSAFTNLKQSNPNLKTYISVGGWAFNDPPTQNVFSDLVASPLARGNFVESLVKSVHTVIAGVRDLSFTRFSIHAFVAAQRGEALQQLRHGCSSCKWRRHFQFTCHPNRVSCLRRG
jgi:hypothetical protein